jgi:hypothetical protein
MNKLQFMQEREIGSIRPYRSYKRGDKAVISKYSKLYNTIESYYRKSNGNVTIIETHDNNYTVEPLGFKDTFTAGHKDLIPLSLVESRLFVPIMLVKPGVVVKMMCNGEKRLVSETRGDVAILENDSQVHGNRLVEILCRQDDVKEFNSFIEKTR